MSNDPKLRYNDEDLQEFKELVTSKLTQAQDELTTTEQQIADLNENGFNQHGGDWYDDSTAHTDLEMLQRMLTRQQRHVQDLKNALLRIHNKTYGICTVTGQLISKERLKLVPHATKSIDGKNISSASREIGGGVANTGDFFAGGESEDKPLGKSVGDGVRIANSKKNNSGGGDEWETDNENMEESSYQPRKFDDDDE